MSVRFTAKARRGMVALTVATGLALGVAGCGGGGSDDKKPEKSASASKDDGSKPSAQEGTSQDPLAARDSGGFVTVNANFKNDGSETVVVPSNLSGNETEIIKNGSSLGGATLVDSKGKKRYYVLRDTDGRPLTTTGLPTLKAGETVPVFMQFPSPPTSTTEVGLQLPGFPTATITISG